MRAAALRSRFGLGRNPLRRTSDRIEAAVLWMALLACLLAVPAAVAVGVAANASSVRTASARAASARPVVAHTLESAPVTPMTTVSVQLTVAATWTDLGGVSRTGRVAVVPGTGSGESVTIWLDRDGHQVAAPRDRVTSAVLGVATAAGVLALAVLAVAALAGTVRLVLDRRRLREWGEGWDRVAGTWCRC